jgi:ribonuclease T1
MGQPRFRAGSARSFHGFSWRQWLSGLLLLLALVGAGLQARSPQGVLGQDPATVALRELPPQGQAVMGLIRQGGPFRYEKDGTVFGNRERLLPRAQRGYYREYTVDTPGLRHRGARRIVCGGEVPSRPETCYYTEDHYASFRLIVQ